MIPIFGAFIPFAICPAEASAEADLLWDLITDHRSPVSSLVVLVFVLMLVLALRLPLLLLLDSVCSEIFTKDRNPAALRQFKKPGTLWVHWRERKGSEGWKRIDHSRVFDTLGV